MGTDKRARKKANRTAKAKAEQAAAVRARRTRTAVRVGVLTVIAVALFLLMSNARDQAATTTSAPSTDTSTTSPSAATAWEAIAALPVACNGTAPTAPPTEMQFDEPGDLALTGPVVAELVTTCGTVTIELDPASAPESVNAFVFLAEAGYYDRTAVHRIATDYVMQGGDPTATGLGGPGFTLPAEFPAVGTAYPRGTVALARSGAPDSSGSQFFIVLADAGAGHLGSSDDLLYNILGTVTDGFDVLDAVNAVPTEGDRPTEGVFVETVRIDR